jgi:hypothetical protein
LIKHPKFSEAPTLLPALLLKKTFCTRSRMVQEVRVSMTNLGAQHSTNHMILLMIQEELAQQTG